MLPFVSGREAVILFFVISGFVLSLGSPVTSPAQYVAFALRRIGRIYLPFVAAVALSGVCCMLFIGRSLPLADWYYSSWHEPVTLAIVLRELTLSPTVTLNPSFWSLSYEIVISLMFPSFWWLMRRGAWSVAALVSCKLLEVWVWKHGFGSTYVAALLYYLTFFMLGVALAQRSASALAESPTYAKSDTVERVGRFRRRLPQLHTSPLASAQNRRAERDRCGRIDHPLPESTDKDRLALPRRPVRRPSVL